LKLYNFEKSGNCYKVRLFLSILDKPYEEVPIDILKGESLTENFLDINIHGFVPVLLDKDVKIIDSAAILMYLATKYGDEKWLPRQAENLANVVRWMIFEQSDMRYGLARARLIKLKIPSDLSESGSFEESTKIGRNALNIIERQLQNKKWLVTESHPSIADIACFPYIALCSQGGFSLEEHDSIRRWIDQIREIPGYIDPPN
tara:strand:- start:6511 stop:7119 length:609 start_codon:yes stop_codon:yes gene_type:complete